MSRLPDEQGHDTERAQQSAPMPSLAFYLSRINRLAFANPRKYGSSKMPSPSGVTLVLGNPSADLDSFVSAVVTSYWYNLRGDGKDTDSQRQYVPILNLPTVSSTDLWRLRPEFGVALMLAMRGASDSEKKPKVLEELVTIRDVESDKSCSLHGLFSARELDDNGSHPKQQLFLVDHNAPAIEGLRPSEVDARFEVVACIDHHVDEGYTPRNAMPRIVTTGIGSCTSLVVQHLRDQGLWRAPAAREQESDQAFREICRLALAPILIDTANLKATGDKCSDTDREAVKFLEEELQESTDAQMTSTSHADWNRDAFYDAISDAKANSLDLLTMQETFDRDYKVWTEPGGGGAEVNVGVSSLVKPLSWLIKHAGGIQQFLDEINTFALADQRRLGVYCMLTRAGEGKEVVVIALDEHVHGAIDEFEQRGGHELDLKEWSEDHNLIEALDRKWKRGSYKIWWMGDTSKSRKQVGPLLREAVRNAA